jgi:hypothetical protein
MRIRVAVAAATLAALAAGLTACSSGGGAGSVIPGPESTAPSTVSTGPPTVPLTGRLPQLAAPPDISAAEAALGTSLRALHAAALGVTASGSDAALNSATTTINRDLSVVQKNFQLANAAGRAGNCAASFVASISAHDAFIAVKHDEAALSRAISHVRTARTKYESARRAALQALQQLYNAIAGHPLKATPSTLVGSLQTTMATDDQTTNAATTRAGAVLTAAHQASGQAKKAASDAAMAACLDVSA